MESDDLMAAVFRAAACQDNATGPIEIPDHVLVRQTIDDTLHEALDVDGSRPCSNASSPGDVPGPLRRHHRAVTAHEIITARPYAFLDDEEFQNRRTNAVHLRRGRGRPGLDRGARPRGDRAGARGDRAGADHRRRPPRPGLVPAVRAG